MGFVRIDDKSIEPASDGYFEFHYKDDTGQSLLIDTTIPIYIREESSGLIIVLPIFGKPRRDPK